jgi:hypothetical protein
MGSVFGSLAALALAIEIANRMLSFLSELWHRRPVKIVVFGVLLLLVLTATGLFFGWSHSADHSALRIVTDESIDRDCLGSATRTWAETKCRQCTGYQVRSNGTGHVVTLPNRRSSLGLMVPHGFAVELVDTHVEFHLSSATQLDYDERVMFDDTVRAAAEEIVRSCVRDPAAVRYECEGRWRSVLCSGGSHIHVGPVRRIPVTTP